MATVSNKAWSEINESDYKDASAFCAACLIDENESGGEKTKDKCKLPVYEPSGALNSNALSSAAGYLNDTQASAEAKDRARKKLLSLYKQANMEPPESLQSKQTAYQTPYDESEAVELGSKLWRKQVLPHRSISYKGGTLSITPEMAKRVVENHKKRPFEYVPFVIGHSDNPEAGRGEVVGLSNSADGVEAIIQTDDAGTKMIEGNGGKLPVSVRLLEDYTRESDGEHFGPVIQHVAATYTPRMVNMRPWEAVEASDAPSGVVDLSEESYDALQANTDDGLSDEDRALIAEVEREVADEDEADDGESSEDTEEEDYEMADMPSEGDTIQFKRGGATHEGTFKRVEGEGDSQVAVVDVDGEEVKVPVSMLQKGSGSEGDSGESGAKDNSESNEGSDMSESDRRIADLEERYQNRIAELEGRVSNSEQETRNEKAGREYDRDVQDGVPRWVASLKRDMSVSDSSQGTVKYVDLSEDGVQEKDISIMDAVGKLVDGYRRTVEFGEKGDASAQLSEDDARVQKTQERMKETGESFAEAARHIS